MSSNVRPATMERITTPALAESFIDQQLAELRQQIGDKKVLLALSGGVDSSVVAALLIKAIGKQLICVHVNHGLLRKGEPEQVIEVFQNQMDANLIYVDAVDRFLDKLAGISDRSRSARSSARSSSTFSLKKLRSWRASPSWLRAPFTPTFWNLTASSPTTT